MPANIFTPTAANAPTPQAQAAQLQAQMQQLQGSTGLGNAAQDENYAQQLNGLNAQTASTNDPFNQYRTQLLGLANGELSSAQNNPMDQSISSALMGQIQSGGPYTPQVQATMNAQQSDMTGAAEKGQLSQLAANGLSPTDPAYQSRVSELESNRAGANQSAFANTANTATLGNWNAEQGALSNASNFSAEQQGREMGASQNLQGVLGAWSEPQNSGGQINRPGASQPQGGAPSGPANIGSLSGSLPSWGGGQILGSGSAPPPTVAPGSTGGASAPYGNSPTDYTGLPAQNFGSGSGGGAPPDTSGSSGGPGMSFNQFRKAPPQNATTNPFIAQAKQTNPFMGN